MQGDGGGGGGGGEGESPLSGSGAAQAAAGAEKEEGEEDRGRGTRRGNRLQRNTMRAWRHVCQAFLLCTPTYNPAENVPETQSCVVTYI